MKINYLTFVTFIFSVFFLTQIQAQAQESVNTAGGNASGSGGSSSYSIGQIVYSTQVGTNGSLAQGVQQPLEISVIIALDETSGINLVASAYPNPTYDFLTLKIDDFASLTYKAMTYQLFDMNGALLETKKIESTETRINTNNLVSSTYFIKIISDNIEIKIFKIIKN